MEGMKIQDKEVKVKGDTVRKYITPAHLNYLKDAIALLTVL
jgi:hypothetical protein